MSLPRNALDAFRAAVRTMPDGPALIYFDGRLSYRELDRASDALAGWLIGGGVEQGDRVALYLQNMPGFVIGLLAAWKAGAVPVPVNPMNRQRELIDDVRRLHAGRAPLSGHAVSATIVIQTLPEKAGDRHYDGGAASSKVQQRC